MENNEIYNKFIKGKCKGYKLAKEIKNEAWNKMMEELGSKGIEINDIVYLHDLNSCHCRAYEKHDILFNTFETNFNPHYDTCEDHKYEEVRSLKKLGKLKEAQRIIDETMGSGTLFYDLRVGFIGYDKNKKQYGFFEFNCEVAVNTKLKDYYANKPMRNDAKHRISNISLKNVNNIYFDEIITKRHENSKINPHLNIIGSLGKNLISVSTPTNGTYARCDDVYQTVISKAIFSDDEMVIDGMTYSVKFGNSFGNFRTNNERSPYNRDDIVLIKEHIKNHNLDVVVGSALGIVYKDDNIVVFAVNGTYYLRYYQASCSSSNLGLDDLIDWHHVEIPIKGKISKVHHYAVNGKYTNKQKNDKTGGLLIGTSYGLDKNTYVFDMDNGEKFVLFVTKANIDGRKDTFIDYVTITNTYDDKIKKFDSVKLEKPNCTNRITISDVAAAFDQGMTPEEYKGKTKTLGKISNKRK